MTELLNGFDSHGVHLFQSKDDPQTFYYIPGEPTPERNPAGTPMLQFLITDQAAIFQLGMRWEVNADLLDALRAPLQDRYRDINPALIRFSPAPITIEGVALMLIADDGQPEEIQTVTSSGFPPYTALFNTTLTAAQKARVASALNGRKGLLKVVYKSSLASEVRAETSVTGDVSADISELAPDASLNECQRRIEVALNDGRLHLERTVSDAAPAQLREKADRLAKDKAADILSRMASKEADVTLDAANLKASAFLTMTVSQLLTRSTDVGSWYTSGANIANIMIAPGSFSPTTAGRHASAMISIEFDMKEVPVAFVQLSWDDQAEIRPPVFSPATLKGRTDESLVVKTLYTDGGPPYETKLAPPPTNELKLTPQDLGLALITADANSLRQAGAKHAEIRVNYKPDGAGTADEHLIRFHFGDWTDSWYVVTRDSGLGGKLEVEIKETDAEGAITPHPTMTTDKTEITL